jgi:hypothetical protein
MTTKKVMKHAGSLHSAAVAYLTKEIDTEVIFQIRTSLEQIKGTLQYLVLQKNTVREETNPHDTDSKPKDSYFAIEQMSEQRQWRLRSLKALSFCLGLPVVAVVLSVPDGPNNVQTKIKIGF